MVVPIFYTRQQNWHLRLKHVWTLLGALVSLQGHLTSNNVRYLNSSRVVRRRLGRRVIVIATIIIYNYYYERWNLRSSKRRGRLMMTSTLVSITQLLANAALTQTTNIVALWTSRLDKVPALPLATPTPPGVASDAAVTSSPPPGAASDDLHE